MTQVLCILLYIDTDTPRLTKRITWRRYRQAVEGSGIQI